MTLRIEGTKEQIRAISTYLNSVTASNYSADGQAYSYFNESGIILGRMWIQEYSKERIRVHFQGIGLTKIMMKFLTEFKNSIDYVDVSKKHTSPDDDFKELGVMR